ncbi:MAG: glycosyltransferase family 4 protein [Flavisolibacter sp.]|nr:glycosyltransferase family 4 protein [Flavisolibacter sp.]
MIITYYWPPSGGAAVQRWLSFANKLADKNYTVYVLTVDENYATYQLRDESLLKQVNPSIEVYTTKTSEPFKAFTFLFGKKSMPMPAFSNETNASFIKKASRFIRGNFFIPDPRKGWKRFAVKKAVALIQKENIHCVITAGPPHSTHFIGKELKESLDIYWIADFHDLWTDVIYYDMLYHLPIIKRLDKKLERTILETADLIFTVGDKYKEKLLSKSNKIIPDNIKILRIGYEEIFFDHQTAVTLQDQFIITYTGTIANFYQPQVFITALKGVTDKFPEVSFRLRFAGILSGDIKEAIINAGLNSILDDLGYLSHHESILLLENSTVLLLVSPVTKNEEMVIPGKIYEYLAARKPIINITKQGSETASLITNCQAGKTFERNQQRELENYLTALVEQWKVKGTLDIKNNEQLIIEYSRDAITEQLIKTLPN